MRADHSAATTRQVADPAAVLRRIPAVPALVVGAACIAFSAPLVSLSHTDAVTASFYRRVFAVPVLALLAVLERRRRGGVGARQHVFAVLAGVLLGGDLLLWSQSISEVGAGVSTVIVNLQVVLVPVLALLIDREPLTRRFVLAVVPMLVGVALAGGVGSSDTGSAPLAGTIHAVLAAVCYAGYLFLLRRGSSPQHLVLPVLDVTVAAAVVATVAAAFRGIEFTPGAASLGWLIALALSGQVVGWLLIAMSLPRLATRTGASLLLLQPVGAVALGYVLLQQAPAVIQLVGCVLVLAAVLLASWHNRSDDGHDDTARSGPGSSE